MAEQIILCAWCGRLKICGVWTQSFMPASFIKEILCSHGICDSCKGNMIRGIKQMEETSMGDVKQAERVEALKLRALESIDELGNEGALSELLDIANFVTQEACSVQRGEVVGT